MVGSHTKERIFEEAVRLFSQKGYPVVPLKEVAKAVNVSEATIYRHYKNKADLLNEIIKTLEFKLDTYLPTQKQVDKYIETETPCQLLMRCTRQYKNDEIMMMSRLYRIAYMEQLTNPAARSLIVGKLHDETAKIIKYALDKLIEKELIRNLDTQFVSVLWARLAFANTVIWIGQYTEEVSADVFVGIHNALFDRMIEMVTAEKAPAQAKFFTP